jgi:hypothetical protein
LRSAKEISIGHIKEDEMATRNKLSKGQAARAAAASTPDLLEVVEAERTRLMQAESLLQCLLVALEGEEVETRSPYYPHVIELACELLTRSIGQLDSLRLRPLIEQARGEKAYATTEEKAGRHGADEVKESAEVVYLF